MCELLGYSGRHAADLRGYLKIFYSHSVRHPHGWGMLRLLDGVPQLLREPVCAAQSTLLPQILAEMPPQTAALAHIRLATVGSVKAENCHPFSACDCTGRRWTLIHNGTVYSGKTLIPYRARQSGDTDSERIFLWLMDTLNALQQSRSLSPAERFDVIDRLVITLSPRNKLNLMIYDGELLYVHKNMKHTLYMKDYDGGLLFATVPLDADGWRSVPLARLAAYRCGEPVRLGTLHNQVYIPTLDYITAMDAMNI